MIDTKSILRVNSSNEDNSFTEDNKTSRSISRNFNERKNYFLPIDLCVDKSLNFFKREYLIRKWLFYISCHDYFYIFMAIIIKLNSIILILETYSLFDQVTLNLNRFFIICYIVEFLVKIISLGFIFGRNTYLSDNWNKLDFIVVIIGLWDLFDFSFSNIKILKILRIIRPIKSLSIIPSMKKFVFTLMNSLYDLYSVFLMMILFYFIFSIFGLSLWTNTFTYRCRLSQYPIKGMLMPDNKYPGLCGGVQQCNNNIEFCQSLHVYIKNGSFFIDPRVDPSDDLYNPNLNWGITNFNNFGNAFYVVFQSATLESWSSIMYMIMDGDNFYLSLIYFILLIMIISFFILNLTVAVMLYNFEKYKQDDAKEIAHKEKIMNDPGHIKYKESNKLSKAYGKKENLTLNRKSLHIFNPKISELVQQDIEDRKDMRRKYKALKTSKLDSKASIKQVKFILKRFNKTECFKSMKISGNYHKNNKLAFYMYLIYSQPIFHYIINTCLFLNCIALMLERTNQTSIEKSIINRLHMLIAIFLSLEMTTLIFGIGFKKYFENTANIFDLILTALAILELIFIELEIIFKCFGILRLFKLVRKSNTFRITISSLRETLIRMIDYSIIFLLFIYVYGLLGFHLFNHRLQFNESTNKFDYQGINRIYNFDSFFDSMLSVFIIMIGDSWSSFYFDAMRSSQINKFGCIVFYISLILFGRITLLNIFLAYLIDNFQNAKNFLERNTTVKGHIQNLLYLISQQHDEDIQKFSKEINKNVFDIFLMRLQNKKMVGQGKFSLSSKSKLISNSKNLSIENENLLSALSIFDFERVYDQKDLKFVDFNNQFDFEFFYSFSSDTEKIKENKSEIMEKNADEYFQNNEFSIDKCYLVTDPKSTLQKRNFSTSLICKLLNDKHKAICNETKNLHTNQLDNLIGGKNSKLLPMLSNLSLKNKLKKNIKLQLLNNKNKSINKLKQEYESGKNKILFNYFNHKRKSFMYEKNPSELMENIISNKPRIKNHHDYRNLNLQEEKKGEEELTNNDLHSNLNNTQNDQTKHAPFNYKEFNQRSNRSKCLSIFSYFKNSSLLIFHKNWFFRKAITKLIDTHFFNIFIMIVILFNCIVIILDSPWNDPESNLQIFIVFSNKVFSVVFIIECVLRIISAGFLFNSQENSNLTNKEINKLLLDYLGMQDYKDMLNDPDVKEEDRRIIIESAIESLGMQKAYLRDFSNIFDFVIAIFGILDFIDDSAQNFTYLRTFRSLKSLRPFRLLTRNDNLKIILNVIVKSIPSILNVVLACGTFIYIYAILGINLHKTYMTYYCTEYSIKSENVCSALGYNWIYYNENFRDFLNAIKTLFILMTSEGWIEIMHHSFYTRSKFYMLYFITYMLVGFFFILNLLVSVVIQNFNDLKMKSFFYSQLSEEEQDWVRMQKFILKSNLHNFSKSKIKNGNSDLNFKIIYLVKHKKFDNAFALVIIISMIPLILKHIGQSEKFENILEISNYIFVILFNIELFLKIYTYRKYFLLNFWFIFDFVIVIVTNITLVTILGLNYNAEKTEGIDNIHKIIRALRILRILRLLDFSTQMKSLVDTLIYIVPTVLNILLVLFLIIIIYGSIGVQIFGTIPYRQSITKYNNFRNFGYASLLLFRTITGESWNEIMNETSFHDCQDKNIKNKEFTSDFYCTKFEINCFPDSNLDYREIIAGKYSCGSDFSFIYFISFQILAPIIILNLFVVFIIEGFSDAMFENNSLISKNNLENFQNLWNEFDKDSSSKLSSPEFVLLMKKLDPPLGIAYDRSYIENNKFLMRQKFLNLRKFINIDNDRTSINQGEKNFEIFKFQNSYAVENIFISLDKKIATSELEILEITNYFNFSLHHELIKKYLSDKDNFMFLTEKTIHFIDACLGISKSVSSKYHKVLTNSFRDNKVGNFIQERWSNKYKLSNVDHYFGKKQYKLAELHSISIIRKYIEKFRIYISQIRKKIETKKFLNNNVRKNYLSLYIEDNYDSPAESLLSSCIAEKAQVANKISYTIKEHLINIPYSGKTRNLGKNYCGFDGCRKLEDESDQSRLNTEIIKSNRSKISSIKNNHLSLSICTDDRLIPDYINFMNPLSTKSRNNRK